MNEQEVHDYLWEMTDDVLERIATTIEVAASGLSREHQDRTGLIRAVGIIRLFKSDNLDGST